MGLFPVSLGASDRLLNADHDEVYFKGMPLYKGKVSTTSINMLRMIFPFCLDIPTHFDTTTLKFD